MLRNLQSMLQEGDIININGIDFLYTGDGSITATISGGDGEQPPAQPTLADLMSLIKKQEMMMSSLQEENKKQKAQFEELVDAIANAVDDEGAGGEEELEEKEEPAAPGKVIAATDNNEVHVLQRQLAKMGKQMEEMQKVIEQREEAAAEERELRLGSQRDSLLQGALTEAGVLPNAMDAALKLFRDNIAFDEENETFWFIEDKTGVKLPINEGIKDNMPDYFKASQIQRGGSGGRGSQANALLEQAKTNLTQLHTQARKSGSESDIAAYHAAKKKVLDLEGQRKGGVSAEGGEGARPPAASSGVPRTAVAGRVNRGEESEQ